MEILRQLSNWRLITGSIGGLGFRHAKSFADLRSDIVVARYVVMNLASRGDMVAFVPEVLTDGGLIDITLAIKMILRK
jgi:hypothetical protein